MADRPRWPDSAGAEDAAATGPRGRFHGRDAAARAAGTVTCARSGRSPIWRWRWSRRPRIAPRISEIVMMGGGLLRGRQHHPLRRVQHLRRSARRRRGVRSGVPITCMPLDVTHKALTTRARIDRFRALGNAAARPWPRCWNSSSAMTSRNTAPTAAPLHDPCVIAFLLQPGLFGAARSMSRSRRGPN